MSRALYSISPDDYEFSDSFGLIHSEIGYKKAAINDFITDGEQLVKQKQEKLDAELNSLYEKDEESGRIFEQHDHYYESTVNESLQEAFLLAATTYLYSQFEFSMKEVAKKTAELFKITITEEDLEKYKPEKEDRKKRRLSKIDKFLFYTDETSEINITDLDSYWGKIEIFKQVRNCLTHNNGYIHSNHPKLKELSDSFNGINYGKDSERITISKEYLLEMNKVCFDFLNKIMEKVWINRPR